MGVRKLKTKELLESAAHRSVVEEETIVQMDETIWKELPEELLESVIARLPIATFIRFRSVCHKWNSLPFLQRRAPQELPLIYAATSNHGRGAMYDPLVKKWYYNTHTPPVYDWRSPTCDSGGGLVCYADARDASFHVGNHLTRTWKVFPWPASITRELFVLAFVYNPSGAGGYKIVWVDWHDKYGVLNYSSSEDKTTITEGRIPANFELQYTRGCNGLAIGSVVYFRCRQPDGIMSYDVVSGTWEQLLIAYPSNSHASSLAEGGERLMLVGLVYCNAARIHPCVCVWELDTQIRSWIEVDRMPTSFCSSEFENYTMTRAACLSTRRLLVISLTGQLLKQTRIEELNEIFAYDVISREWSKVPECIPPGRSCLQEVWFGISFFPSLSASPYE